MGGSSSTAAQSPEQQEEESLAVSTGSLHFLRAAFSKLSSPDSTVPLSSLQEVLSLNASKFKSETESLQVPDKFPELISHLSSSIISLYFSSSNNSEISWIDFLKGYNKCCVATPVSQSLTTLYHLHFQMCKDSNIELNLKFDLGENESEKVNGSFEPDQLLCFVWMCWILMHGTTISKQKGDLVILPDVTHLMNSVLGEEREIQVQKFNSWVLSTAVGISNCLKVYLSQKIRSFSSSIEENDLETENKDNNDKYLLTRGRAWAVSLSLRTSSLNDQFLNASFYGMDENNLLYRSSVNGKGLTRFWLNVEGYNGPVFLLISGFSPNSSDLNNNDSNNENKWIIGVLTEQGFENKDTYFGNSAHLYALDPVFHSFSPSGKERNFVYCHVKPTIKVYEKNPKIVGLGFGGTIGNERIFLDDDFSKVIIRHHAADKTYQPGSLIPNQGFLAVEGTIMEVEAWGLGGESVRKKQDLFKKRENLFSEQRRTVDLKNFGNWEDSPEKMMMDMVSDPNRPRREER
ncbi:hypothetical protein LUZ60_011745 [Juncus effusus]|nr:hypothetical protein LUZ60_011745 [Juncus effusus]